MVCSVRPKETTRLSSNTVSWIIIDVQERERLSSYGVIEPSEALFPNKAVKIINGIIDCETELNHVKIANHSDVEVAVMPQDRLGSHESYYDSEITS